MRETVAPHSGVRLANEVSPASELPNPPREVWLGAVRIAPRLFHAPMAGYTNYVFRQLLRNLGGVGGFCTEMVSARGFLELNRRYNQLPERLWGVWDEPRPITVQIWDNDPEKLAVVAERLVEDFGVTTLDVNFGCPAEQITKGVACGAYLLRDPETIGRIISQLVRKVAPVPVTAKIRLGWDEHSINAPEVAQIIEQAGGAGVFVHCRTAQQKYRGSADWTHLAEIKRRVKRIPVIGNGDIRSAADVLHAFKTFPVDGVMIGRAALARPWIFRQAAALLAGTTPPPEPTSEEQYGMLDEQSRQLMLQFGEEKAAILMRRFVCHFVAGRRGAKRFRVLLCQAHTPGQILAALREFLFAETR